MISTQELLPKRMQELALRAHFSGRPTFTRFLEPAMDREARAAAAQADVQIAFFGGYDEAERKIAAFYSEAAPDAAQAPIACLELKWNSKYANPGHRDLLGAVMGLGLDRDSTGDIAMGAADGCAYLFVHRDVEDYIIANLESAGRASLKLHPAEMPPAIRPPQGVALRATVSSPRMDAVIAAGLKLSRGEAQRLIEGGLVKRNHIEELRGDMHLQEGDLLSVRGYGRMRVEGFDGITRKGRQAVRLFRYTG